MKNKTGPRNRNMSTSGAIADATGDQNGNTIWERLPAAVFSDVLARLTQPDLLSCSSTCLAWRAAVKGSLVTLAPKSVLALPFIGGCSSLRSLTLSQALPGSTAGVLTGFHHITAASHLTHLCLASSSTAAWQGRAATLPAAGLAHITALRLLQMLDLSHQPLLQQAGALRPLTSLPHLSHLTAKLTGSNWHLPASSWQVLAGLTGLRALDVSSCDVCFVDTPGRASAAAAAAGGCGSCSSGGTGSSRTGSSIPAVAGAGHAQEVLCGRRMDAAAAGAAGASSGGSCQAASSAAAVGQAQLVPAPLHLLSSLSLLQQITLADWQVPPCAAGMRMLSQLPALTSLDLSHCMVGGAMAAAHQQQPLLAVLTGSSSAQQQQQQQDHSHSSHSSPQQRQLHLQQQQEPERAANPSVVVGTAQAAAAAATPNPNSRSSSSRSGSSVFFSHLLQLECTGTHMGFSEELWCALPGLTALNLSGSDKLTGQGLARLQQLQVLVLNGCEQLDYDALAEVLSSCRTIRQLDLQQSTIILNGSGTTGQQLSQGRYRGAAAAALQPKRRQQQQQQQSPPATAGNCVPGSCSNSSSSSRRDVGGGAVSSSTAGPCAAAAAGLEVLKMSGCGLALEGLAWHTLPLNPDTETPADPSLLLLDLVARAYQGLRGLRVLHWSQCTNLLVDKILSHLVPAAAQQLQELELTGSCLPYDPSRCWQGLAAATGLNRLDLSHVGLSRQGFANVCGTNPTVALLAAVAGMKGLRELGLAGWRFYFANFHVLAGLTGLQALDLSNSMDMNDGTLWSLTHLTGLTRLSLSGAAPSTHHIWNLIFFHLTHLRQLDLSHAGPNFNSASVASLMQLTGLTSLDLRGTKAGDEAAIKQLAKLSNCRRLALSLLPPSSGSSSSRWQHQAGSNGFEAVHPADAAVLAAEEDAAAVGANSSAGSSSGNAGDGAAGGQAGAPPATEHTGSSLLQQLMQHLGHSRITQRQSQARQQQGPGMHAPDAAVPAQVPLQRQHVQQQQQQHSSDRQTQQGQQQRRGSSSSIVRLDDYSYLAVLGQCQSLRQLVLGAGPAVAEYCRQLLPPWIEVR